MDQAQLLSLIGSLYDKLVADVAARVQSQVDLNALTTTWVDARVKVALADHSPEIDMDALRELVTPLVGSMVEEAISAHQGEYNHDEYDEAVNKLDHTDFDDFVKHDALEDSVKDAIRDLTFEVSVS
jgi:hypothetical protein